MILLNITGQKPSTESVQILLIYIFDKKSLTKIKQPKNANKAQDSNQLR